MSLTSLSAVKHYKGVTATDHDSELLRLIGAVDAFVARYCGRVLESTTLTEYQSGEDGQTRLFLREYPVTAITSIHDDPRRTYGAETQLSTNDYVLTDPQAGIVDLDGTSFRAGRNNIRVVYTAGYAATAPERALLEQAAIELVWLARDKGEKALLGVRSRSIADGRVETLDMDWPAGVREILDRFRRRGW
jgi:hypothetical protein